MIDKGLEIYELNLAVANACNANCIYCPRSFVQHQNKLMPLDLVKGLMAETKRPIFKDSHKIVHSVIGENGEPLLHPGIVNILREVRKSGNSIAMFTNFSLFYKELAEEIIKDKLIDSVNVNIDGASLDSYRAVKGLNLETVEENLRNFIDLRNRFNPGIHIFIHVVSHYTYTQAVRKNFEVDPIKGNGKRFPQDGPAVVEKWQPFLIPNHDGIGESGVLFWAERYNKNPKPVDHGCPNIGRLRHVAYINPDGDWYACCFDIGNDLKVGNVYEEPLLKIAESSRRKDLIEKLEQKRNAEIGFPCVRVDSCGGMPRAGVD